MTFINAPYLLRSFRTTASGQRIMTEIVRDAQNRVRRFRTEDEAESEARMLKSSCRSEFEVILDRRVAAGLPH